MTHEDFSDAEIARAVRRACLESTGLVRRICNEPKFLEELLLPHVTEGIIRIPVNATCRSLLDAAWDALNAGYRRAESYFEKNLLNTSFPVTPGTTYRFRRTPLVHEHLMLMPELRTKNEQDGFTGKIAPWLALMAKLGRPENSLYFTLPTAEEMLQLHGQPCGAPFYSNNSELGCAMDVFEVGVDTLGGDTTIFTFREECA